MALGAARGWFLVGQTFLPVRSIRVQARRVERKEQIYHLPFDIFHLLFGIASLTLKLQNRDHLTTLVATK